MRRLSSTLLLAFLISCTDSSDTDSDDSTSDSSVSESEESESRPSDSVGPSDSETDVESPALPEVEITGPVPDVVVGETTSVTATAEIEGETLDGLSAAWHLTLPDGSGRVDLGSSTIVVEPPDLATTEITFPAAPVGDLLLHVEVTGAEEPVTTSIPFTVDGLPSAPDISIVGLITGDSLSVVFDSPSVDPEADTVTYAYAWTLDGSPYGTDEVIDGAAVTRGQVWDVSVTPSDSFGSGSAGTASLTVGNAPPELASATVTPTDPREGSTLTCTPGASTDPESDTVQYSYTWSVNGSAVTSATTSSLGSDQWVKGDDVTCTVVPSDSADSGASVTSAPVTILNTVPSVTGAEITPAIARVGDTISCAAVGYADADNDSDQSTVEWLAGGSVVGTSASYTLTSTRGQEVTCRVTPNDGSESGTPASAMLIVANTAPLLAGVTLDQSEISELQGTNCVAGLLTDADGDGSLSTTTEWLVNGSVIAHTGTSIDGTHYAKGDTVACRLTPTDTFNTGTAVDSAELTVVNSPPSLSSVELSDYSPLTNESVQVLAAATDPDNDPINFDYTWLVDGATVSGIGSVDTLEGSSHFDRGQEVIARVVVTDDDVGNTIDSPPAIVGNSAPTAPTVSMTAGAPGVDALHCEIITEGTDPDNDPLDYTFTWVADGSVYPGGLNGTTGPTQTDHPGDTIPAADTLLASDFDCTAVSSDGDLSSGGATAQATIPATQTYGYTNQGSTWSTHGANFLLGQKINIGSAITVTHLAYISNSSGISASVSLYEDSGGSPGDLVVSTGSHSMATGTREISVTPTSVSSGDYWIMTWFSGTASIGEDASTGTNRYRAWASGAAPDPAGSTASYAGSLHNLWVVGY